MGGHRAEGWRWIRACETTERCKILGDMDLEVRAGERVWPDSQGSSQSGENRRPKHGGRERTVDQTRDGNGGSGELGQGNIFSTSTVTHVFCSFHEMT